MNRPVGRDLLHRWEGNPVLTLDDMPFRCNTVFNGSPVRVPQGYFMIVRVEGQQGYSFFALARSDDGLNFRVDKLPCMLPDSGEFRKWEEFGIEDPRLTFIEGKFYMLYTAVGPHGFRIALAEVEDFRHYRRIAVISDAGNKDGVLFPRKINGLYARLDRPTRGRDDGIWISYSPDLIHWGLSKCVIHPRKRYWDSNHIGASAPPILTEHGWLEIYHGVKMTSAGPIYRIGTVMLDAEDPSRVAGRCYVPILSPREDYERIGDVNNVVFACGAITEDDGEVKVYYGAADTAICVASASLEELIESSLESGPE